MIYLHAIYTIYLWMIWMIYLYMIDDLSVDDIYMICLTCVAYYCWMTKHGNSTNVSRDAYDSPPLLPPPALYASGECRIKT